VSLPAGPGRADLTLRLVADLGALFHLRASYAKDHPQVALALERVLAALHAWCAYAGAPEVSLILVEGHLLVDRQPIPDDASWARGLLRAFQRHDIGGLTLFHGLDAAELLGFLDDCLSAKGPVSTPHLHVGRGGFSTGDAPETPGGAGAPAAGPGYAVPSEQVQGARAEFAAVAAGGASRIDRLRQLVAQLARSAGPGAIDPEGLDGARADDREFIHGLAVALTTTRLARALRIEGKALEDLALAGLLHDVGHLEPAVAGENPARRRHLHPVRGAARIAGLDGVPDVAVLAALEHHLRFDRAPASPSAGPTRMPGAAARVVAVADSWETIRVLPDVRLPEALAVLRARAGAFLDPALVELLTRLQQGAAPGA
jgi:HD superfamily phosphohydrolase YqeK